MNTPPAIRLPRAIEADPRADLLIRTLSAADHRLWSGGSLKVPEADLSSALCEALRAAQRAGRVIRSLEKAETLLTAEGRGQRLADHKAGAPRGRRLSRLLLLAADGAERFYRRVETVINQNQPRLAAIYIVTDASRLGSLIFGPGASARLLMIDHKEAVASVLLALADQWERSHRKAPPSLV